MAVTLILILTISVVAAAKQHIDNKKSNHNQDIEEDYPDEDAEAYELPERTLNSDVIPYDGVPRTISCWGDSMMFGMGAGEAYIVFGDDEPFDISGWTSPDTLQYLTGIKVYNLGVSGETSYEIALRQGGIKMYVRDTFEVGYDDSVDVTIVDENGGEVYMADFSAYGYTEPQESDIVYINDEMFKITGTEEEGLHICRYSDEEVNYDAFTTVYADTQVYTKASYERKNDILILEIGSNGGWENYRQLISQYDAMIQNSGCDYYIIVGDTDDPGTSIADTTQGIRNEDDPRFPLAAIHEALQHRMDMKVITNELAPDLLTVQCRPDDTGLAVMKSCHGIEQMRHMVDAVLLHGFHRFFIGSGTMADR